MNLSDQFFSGTNEMAPAHNFRRLFIRTALLIIVFLAVIFLINSNQKRELATNQLFIKTKDVILQSEKTISLVKDYEASTRGFAISGNEEFLTPVKNTKDSIRNAVINLKQLVSESPSQKATADSLGNYIQKRLGFSDSSIYLRRNNGLDAALQFVSSGEGKRCMDTIRMLQAGILTAENKLLAERRKANSRAIVVNRITLSLSLLAFFVLLVILFWQAWFNLKKYNTRQKEVNAMLKQLAQSLINAQKLSHIGSWEWNTSTDEVKWSDEQYRIFGYEPDSVHATHKFFLNAIYPTERPLMEMAVQNAVEEKTAFDICFRIIQLGGKIRHVHALGEVHTNAEGALILAGTIQDITEQVMKEKENMQLAQMLDKTNRVARIGWWEMNMMTGKRKWSNVTKEILELPHDYEPRFSLNYFVKDRQSKEIMEKVFADAVKKGTPYDIIIPVVTQKGNTIQVRAIGQPEFEDGQCVRIYGIFQQLSLHNEYHTA